MQAATVWQMEELSEYFNVQYLNIDDSVPSVLEGGLLKRAEE